MGSRGQQLCCRDVPGLNVPACHRRPRSNVAFPVGARRCASLDSSQFCDPSGSDPLSDIDIAIKIKASIMGMDKLSLLPTIFVGPNCKSF
jgi:hypothetical protein